MFIDRDGTLNRAPVARYLLNPGELQLLPGVAAAVRRLNEAGVAAYVVTNQQGVAWGRPDRIGLAAIHDRLSQLLAQQGAHLDGIYVCPHLADSCDCRKPRDGLLRQAVFEHGLDPRRCAIVGDHLTDMIAGTPMGLFRVLVSTDRLVAPAGVDRLAADLLAAVRMLLD